MKKKVWSVCCAFAFSFLSKLLSLFGSLPLASNLLFLLVLPFFGSGLGLGIGIGGLLDGSCFVCAW